MLEGRVVAENIGVEPVPVPQVDGCLVKIAAGLVPLGQPDATPYAFYNGQCDVVVGESVLPGGEYSWSVGVSDSLGDVQLPEGEYLLKVVSLGDLPLALPEPVVVRVGSPD